MSAMLWLYFKNGTSQTLHYVLRYLSWHNSAEKGSHYWITRTSLFKQLLDICFYRFPDLLDLETKSFAIIPIYFVAGFLDFGIITLAVSTFRQLSIYLNLLRWPLTFAVSALRLSSVFGNSIVQSLQAPPNEDSHSLNFEIMELWLFQIALLFSFVARLSGFGFSNIRRFTNFKALQWTEMWKLNVLILCFCPALFWASFTRLVFAVFKLDGSRPWLSAAFFFLLSADWDTAKLRSGWYFTDVKNGTSLSEYNENSTWVDVIRVSVRKTAIAVPLEILLKNTPTLLLTAVIALQYLSRLILIFVTDGTDRLRRLTLMKKYVLLEEVIATRRDQMVIRFIQLIRRSRKYGVILRTGLQHVKPLLSHYIMKVQFTYRWLQWQSTEVFQKPSVNPHPDFATSSTVKESATRRMRLLEINPSLHDNDPITCTLSWYDLDAPPNYTAISYVWGSDDRDSTVTINNETCKTTASAKRALRALRDKWMKHKVWIDAICIDQDSVEDKASQLSVMAAIYRKANEVVVWLGPDPDAVMALSLARRLFLHTRLKSTRLDPLLYCFDLPQYVWQALRRLLENRWFERGWVVQEVLSGRQVTIQYGDATINWMLFSFITMAIANESRIMEKLRSVELNADLVSSTIPALKISHMRAFEELRAVNLRQSKNHEHLSLLFYLVRMFRSSCKFKVTQNKDRIYALISLCGLADHPKFRPDYKSSQTNLISEADLFVEVAQHFLTSGPEKHRLDVLAHAGLATGSGYRGNKSIPSWVPDWSNEKIPSMPFFGQEGTSELLHHPRLSGILEDIADLRSYDEVSYKETPPERKAALEKLRRTVEIMKEKTLYRAAGKTSPRIAIYTKQRSFLEVHGLYLDQISTLRSEYPTCPRRPTSKQSVRELHDIAALIRDWFAVFSVTQGLSGMQDFQRNIDLFCRTLLADLNHPTADLTRPDPSLRPAPRDRVQHLIDHVTILWESISGKLDLEKYLREENETTLKLFWDIQSHMTTICAGRAFGVTAKKIPGMFPRTSREGDQVCLFLGADVPFVVRSAGIVPWPTGYSAQSAISKEAGLNDRTTEPGQEPTRPVRELVGPAYLHGFMDGEGIDKSIEKPKAILLMAES